MKRWRGLLFIAPFAAGVAWGLLWTKDATVREQIAGAEVPLEITLPQDGEPVVRPADRETAAGKLEFVLWILRDSEAADLPDLWRELASNEPLDDLLRFAILSRWSRIDPAGGMAFLADRTAHGGVTDMSPFGDRPAWALMGLWMARDIRAARACPEWSPYVEHYGVQFLSTCAPGSLFCERIEPHLSEGDAARMGGGHIHSYTDEDPEAALAWAKQLADPVERAESMLVVYLKTDLVAGLDFIDTLPMQHLWEHRRGDLFQALAVSDLDAALARSLTLSPGGLRNGMTPKALCSIAIKHHSDRKEYREAMAIVHRPEFNGPSLVDQLMGGWLRHDSQAALDHFATLSKKSRHFEDIASRVIGNLAETDPAEAFALADETLESPQHLAGAKSTAIFSLYKADADAALALLGAHPVGYVRDALMRSVAPQMVADEEGVIAMELAESIEGDSVRSQTVNRVFLKWTAKDPAAAVEWLVERPTGRERDSLLSVAASAVAVADFSAGLELISEMSEETQLSTAEHLLESRAGRIHLRTPEDKVRAIEASSLESSVIARLIEELE